MRIKIFGSAGTGKTTTVAKIVKKLAEQEGIDYSNVYGLSLTRAAKWSLINKLKRKEEDLEILERNILTLHSFAYRNFRQERELKIAKSKVIKEFFEKKGFEFKTQDDIEDFDNAFFFTDFSQYSGNRLYQLFTLMRLELKYLTVEDVKEFIEKARDMLPVSPRHFVQLLQEFSDWLKQNDVWDFTRLLTELYKRDDIQMYGDILIIDEGQDIAPLNQAILNKYLDNFRYVIIAGDDDQAIFGFASATPDFMLNTVVDKEIILPISYRLPRQIWRLARYIIDKNIRRKYKDFKPRDEEGYVGYLYSYDEALEKILRHKDEGVYILARNNVWLRDWISVLEKYDIPYKLIGKKHTVPQKLIKALHLLKNLKSGKSIPEDEALWLLRYIRLGRVKSTTHAKIAKAISLIATHGINSATPEGKVIRRLLDTPVDKILSREDRNVLRLWWRRIENIDEWKNPKIKLSTIHSAKGLESSTVILDTRITNRVLEEAYMDIEPERRVAYVGVTRARNNLYLVTPNSRASNYFELGIL